MPTGPGPRGLAPFASVKLVGCTAAAWALKRVYPDSKAAVAKVGAARTAIGIGAGPIFGAFWSQVLSPRMPGNSSEYFYFLG
jgi:hypothetical protein